MKKQTLIKSLVILIPILAVGLATTVNSVTVFDTVNGTTEYYSYFELIPVANLQMLTPLAAFLSLISGILAAIFLGKKSVGCLKASGYVALGAAIAVCIPVMIRGDVIVVPNVAFPVFMLVQYLVARYVAKLPVEEKGRNKAPRLKKR